MERRSEKEKRLFILYLQHIRFALTYRYSLDLVPFPISLHLFLVMELGVVEVEYSWMVLELRVIENARLTIRCYSHLPMNHFGFLLKMLHVESVSGIDNHK